MREMVERVAKAIRPGVYGQRAADWSEADLHAMRAEACDQARRAIEAMREPTEAMTAEGFGEGFFHEEADKDSAARIYRAMIDAALNAASSD